MKAMKTVRNLLMVLAMGAAWSTFAQIPMNMNEKIREEQVPVAVLKTLQADFSTIKNEITNGNWYAHFEHTANASLANSAGSRAIPLHYSFKGKVDGNKVELKFTPEGKLVTAKGVDLKPGN